MLKRIRGAVVPGSVVIIFLLSMPGDGFSWGFWAHRAINRSAVDTLPPEVRPFFEFYRDSLTAHAVDADRRRFSDRNEGFYHYINIDRYGKFPFVELPHSYAEAAAKFGKSIVDSNGTVPWRVAEFTAKLSEAMKAQDKERILYYASNLGHYVADAHVPLHATENHDGQMTNQKGIHARWESRIPELYGEHYVLGHGSVEYFKSPLEEIFTVILESSALVDSVLSLDLKAREGIPEGELMAGSQRRGRTVYEFSGVFFKRYHELLSGMVERRMNEASVRLAGFWYTAWIDAGKPDLSKLTKD
ncbi:MAG: zinc dependent phospholipase C family protein [Bacteroidota bacterium]